VANTFSLVIGTIYLAAGVVGFILTPAGGTLLGIFPVNTFHHVFHLVMAGLGLAAGWRGRGRLYCQAAGAVFLLLGLLGFIAPALIAALIAHPHADLLTDNFLHLISGVGLLYFGFLPGPKSLPAKAETGKLAR
jgi:hypothetical protein